MRLRGSGIPVLVGVWLITGAPRAAAQGDHVVPLLEKQ
jgi:hypothetical protein